MNQPLGPTLLRYIVAPLLARLAALMARTRPLDWYAGWRFGVGGSEAGVIGRLKLALWKYFEAHQFSVPLIIQWYDRIKVTLYLGNDLSLCLFVGGAYEPNEFMFLSRVLQPGMNFIDVGANDGLYTLFAASRVGSTGRVVALEPSSREFERLELNIRINHLTNVRPLRLAASDREGLAILRVAGFGHEGQNTLGSFAYPIEGAGSEEVCLVTLDDVVRREALKRIDIVKIDAEGAELSVVRGARELLQAHRPIILFELVEAALHHQGADRGALLNYLQSLGYRFWVFGPSGRPEPASSVELDGVNIIAAHQELRVILNGNGT